MNFPMPYRGRLWGICAGSFQKKQNYELNHGSRHYQQLCERVRNQTKQNKTKKKPNKTKIYFFIQKQKQKNKVNKYNKQTNYIAKTPITK
jgi:hypothetical protein